ncbi:MAG: hypothetical protein SFW35_04865 [Chitinophagales bacterium]|nr:hypothetical protein [Chitinophagales bacterium]
MDIQTRKLHLIEDITKLNDPAIIAKVEELLRTHDTEPTEKPIQPYNLSAVKGLLSAEEAAKYHRHIEQTRSEWEEGI